MLFSKMGKKNFGFKVSRSQEEFQEMAEETRGKGGFTAIVAGSSMEEESQNTKKTRTQQQSTFTRESGDFGDQCTPKELQDWLDQRGISHQALEKVGVAELVDTFLRNGKVKENASFKNHYGMEKTFEEVSREQMDFHTQIGVNKGLSNFFAKGFLHRLAQLNLGVDASGSGGF